MKKDIVISERFCGPPDSGNGGYVAGILAREIAGAVEVTLRKPIPLDKSLDMVAHDGEATLMEGDTLIATARKVDHVPAHIPPAPSREDVASAMLRPIVNGDEGVSFGHCFVCGADRHTGDGLRILCGRLDDGRSASLWVPDQSLDDGFGNVDPIYLWAALDCPGYAAIHEPGKLALLGRFTAEVYGAPKTGADMIVCGEMKGQEGRKFFTETTLYDATGAVVGHAKAIWIAVDAV